MLAGTMSTHQTHGSFNDILAIASPALRPICEALRAQIACLHPEFFEVVWPKQKIASFGTGPAKLSEHYAYIAVHGAHVNLGFYHGALLPDPERLLEGSGKKLRHIKMHDVSASNIPAVSALLRAAIADRKNAATLT